MFDMVRDTGAPVRNDEKRDIQAAAPPANDVVPKAAKLRSRLEHRAGMTLFTWGSGACGAFIVAAAVLGTGMVIAGVDTRPFAAFLPLIYAPMLVGGVGWLVWMSDPARKMRGGTGGS